jgi:hypothetical protein
MLWRAIEGCSLDRVGVGCTRQVSNTAGALWSSGGVAHCTYPYFFHNTVQCAAPVISRGGIY